jgi:hypothetical protein
MTKLENKPDDLMAGRAFQPEILASFETISGLEPKACEELARIIVAASAGGGEPAFHGIAKVLGGSDKAIAEASHIINAAMNTPAANVEAIVEKFQSWVDAVPERSQTFDSDRMQNLQTNLKTLTANREAIALMKKADQIMRSTGNEMQGMQIVCDVRPVFDRKHERIESLLTLANLKIVYQNQVGDSASFELALTRGELMQLKETVDDALGKLALMESLRDQFAQASNRSEGDKS